VCHDAALMPRSLLAIGALAAAVALVVVAALALAGALDENGEPPPPGAVAQGDASTVRLVERVRDGVVLVTVERGRRGVTGSGFMVDDEGFLVTNEHVVAGGGSVSIQAEGASGPIAAEVVGADPATDVALLKIPRDDAGALEPLRLGDDGSVRVGEPVIAVGAPFGLEGTVTAGIVSALDRNLRAPSGFTIDGAIQTDAPIDRGNSGGPLIDADAKVIGINSRVRAGGGRLGYAVPIDTAEEVVEAMRENGAVRTPFIGVATVPVSPVLAGVLGLSAEHGLLVRSVAPGGPADRAGLRAAGPGRAGGDVIVSVDGQAVREPRDTAVAVEDREAGDRISIEIVRGRRRVRLRLTLAEPPS
jgi:S1-C subfamily serine protease